MSSSNPTSPGFRLVALLSGAEVALATAGLVAALVLVFATFRSQRLTSAIGTAVNSVHAAEQAERALLVQHREAHLHHIHAAGGGKVHAQARDQAEHDLARWLATLKNYAETPHEQKALEVAAARCIDYKEERERLEKQGISPSEISTQVAGALDAAQASLGVLVELNFEQARALEEKIRREDQFAVGLGAVSGSAVLVLLVAVFVVLHRKLRQPLMVLHDHVAGTHAAQLEPIPVEGPVELQHISTAFNALVEELLQFRRSQLGVIAGIAHEFRPPLQMIGRSAKVLDLEHMPEEKAGAAQALQENLAQLEQQVSDFIDTTRIEAGHFELRYSELDLVRLVESTIKVFERDSPRHVFKFMHPKEPLIFRFDAMRISQVLNNLLSNAVKYSPLGGDVLVVLSASEGRITLAVKDEGMGIPEADLPHIFEPFRRTSVTRETIPGTGLGLPVVRRIVEAHEGTIAVSSTRTAGTIFTVTLPRAVLALAA